MSIYKFFCIVFTLTLLSSFAKKDFKILIIYEQKKIYMSSNNKGKLHEENTKKHADIIKKKKPTRLHYFAMQNMFLHPASFPRAY